MSSLTLVVADLARLGRPTRIGLGMISALAVVAIAAPLLSPHDPNTVDVLQRLSAPSIANPMGTDQLGRDYLSRVIHGTRTSFTVAMVVVALEATIGLAVGALSGYAGRIADAALMRTVDLVLAFPGLILALAIAALLGPSTTNLIIALVAVGWVSYARLVRGVILTVRALPHVEASRAIGCRPWHIVRRHVVPHVTAPLVVLMTLNLGQTLLGVSALSFLGLGVQPPTAEWGAMLSEGRTFMEASPHLMLFPGTMIVLSVLAVNLIGDGLRDALDPRTLDRVVV